MHIDVNTPFEDLPRLLTVDEFRAITRLGRTSVYDAIRRGEIQTLRVGQRLLIPRWFLRRMLEEPVLDGMG